MTTEQFQKTGFWLDLGLMPYEEAFPIQEEMHALRISGQLPTVVILQENEPVFTVGRTGSRENILAKPEELIRRGIKVLDVNRGGDITYHGPGQLIVSPLLYLGDIGMNANQYFHYLEDILMALLAKYKIRTQKKEGFPGVWHGQAKIASVGIAVKQGHTFHGLSLNINPRLDPFELIHPCGVKKMPVTSMQEILESDVSPVTIRRELLETMGQMLPFQFRKTTLDQVRSLVEKNPGPEKT